MYKYCVVMGLMLGNVNACELMNGITIQDSGVSKLFKTAADLYKDDVATSANIEELYAEYILAMSDRSDTRPLNRAREIENLLSIFIDGKELVPK